MSQSGKHLESFVSFIRFGHVLIPYVMGLMLAYLGLTVSVFEAYRSTNGGTVSSLATYVAAVVFACAVIYFRKTHAILSANQVSRIASVSFVIQAISVVVYGASLFVYNNQSSSILHVAGIVVNISSWVSLFYWFRCARGFKPAATALYVFGAICLAEFVLYLFVFMPQWLSCIIVGILLLAQFVCRDYIQKHSDIKSVRSENPFIDYFGFEDRAVDAPRLLGAFAVGIVLLFVVSGALRGFPSGAPIIFTDETRFFYILILVLYFTMLMWRMFFGTRGIMVSTIWISLEIMAIVGLLFYAAFPRHLEYGAVFTTVFSAALVAYMIYLIIAFASVGDLDMYYYTSAGFIVCIVMRVSSRLGMSAVFADMTSFTLELVLLATIILISTQIVLSQLIMVERKVDKPYGRGMESARLVLGLDSIEPMDREDVREALMKTQVSKMQERFQLTDREAEVLLMYILGKTQRAIATELFLSQGTIHTHIKNIYAKTDLHSRQEVLDFIGQTD